MLEISLELCHLYTTVAELEINIRILQVIGKNCYSLPMKYSSANFTMKSNQVTIGT